MRELRWNRRVHGDAADTSLFDPTQDIAQTVDVHRFGKHIFHHFGHQWMVGDLNISLDVLLACRDIRENRGQQIVGTHALNLRRNFLAALKTQ